MLTVQVTQIMAGLDNELIVTTNAGDDISVRAATSASTVVEVLENGVPVVGIPVIDPATLTRLTVLGDDGNNVINLSAVTGSFFNPNLEIIVDGDDGDDFITGSLDIASTLNGGDGTDVLFGGTQADLLSGGDGQDLLNGGDENDTLNGGDGGDIINGQVGDDVVNGGSSGDTINGGSGADTLNGQSGSDNILGDTDDDVIDGGSGSDTIDGGTGDDSISGGTEADSLLGDLGADTLNGDGGNDSLFGGDDDDLVFGGADDDSLVGENGNDIVNGNSGDDTAFGSSGDDTILGGSGNDLLYGDGDSTQPLLFGNDRIVGHIGNDSIVGGPGADNMDGGSGDDFIQSEEVPFVVIQIDPLFTITEGDVPSTLDVVVLLSGPSTLPISIDVQTVDGTALAGTDYTAVSTVVTIPAGDLGATVSIPVTADTTPDPDVGFTIEFSNAQNAVLATTTATVTIEDDDLPTQVVFLDFDSSTDGPDHVYTATERNAIQQRFEADFAQFSNITFTQTAPVSGPFSTLFFNEPPACFPVCNAAGQAEVLDFRNLNMNDIAFLDVNIQLGGAAQQPFDTNEVINVSSNLGAHELGHILGLTHRNAFGPPGTGVTLLSQPNFTPPYPGPAAAQIDHLMFTPSQGFPANFNNIDLFFSERSAITLAFTQNVGQVNSEQLGSHNTIGLAQPFPLRFLDVPNTIISGANAGLELDVDAATMVGSISASGETDVYAVSFSAGDLVTIEGLSVNFNTGFVGRGINAVDLTLSLRDSSGNLVPYYGSTASSDDDFQGIGDPVLLDLVIPADGTYYIEVSAQDGVDTGEYELFVYTFDTALPTSPPIQPVVPTILTSGDTLVGGVGNDTLTGGTGDDLIDGQEGNDSLEGGGGDDTLISGAGNDTLSGGDGQDTVSGGEGNNTVTGGSGSDVLILEPFANGGNTALDTGGADSVEIRGTAGSDTFVISQAGGLLRVTTAAASITVSSSVHTVRIVGMDGNDTVTMGHINETRPLALIVDLGDGADAFDGLSSLSNKLPIQVLGQGGNDTITGTLSGDILDGGDGDDVISGDRGEDSIRGGAGNDTLNGDLDDDQLLGGDGADSLFGGTGHDLLQGGNDDDRLNGNSGHDTLEGELGNDTLLAGSGHDLARGGSGADSIKGQSGHDTLFGGGGGDTIRGEAGNDIINGGDGDDSIRGGVGRDLITGGEGGDAINGEAGNDTLLGDDGDDSLIGGAGADIVLGGDGDDRVSGSGSNADTVAGNEGDDLLLGNQASEIDETFTVADEILAMLIDTQV